MTSGSCFENKAERHSVERKCDHNSKEIVQYLMEVPVSIPVFFSKVNKSWGLPYITDYSKFSKQNPAFSQVDPLRPLFCLRRELPSTPFYFLLS